MVATCRFVHSGPGARSCSPLRSSISRATTSRRGCRRSCRSSPPRPSRRSFSSPVFARAGDGARSPTRGPSSATSTSSAGKRTPSPSGRVTRSSCFARANWRASRSRTGWSRTAKSWPSSAPGTTSSRPSRAPRARLRCTSNRRGSGPGTGRERALSRRSSSWRSSPGCSFSTRAVSTGSISRHRRVRRRSTSSTGRRLASQGTRPR